ncbi:MAG: hypothetical protein ACR2IV_22205 [Bryobacteraceae bacterium]
MKVKLASSGFIITALLLGGVVTEKPRIFITESQSLQLSGKAALGDAKGGLSLTGGTSPQNVEVMKTFLRRCPAVTVTGNRDKADFVVRLDHEEPNPTTLFVHGNKVAVFTKNDDLIYSTSTRTLASAVKNACEAISGDSRK